jgi:hypothetical protein
MNNSSLNKITASYLNKKKEDNTLGIKTVTVDKINNHAVKMLVASSLPITKASVTAFVFASTDYALSPYNESYMELTRNDGNHYASIVAYRMPFKMKISADSMVQISASSYLDSTVDEVWEKTEMEGKSVFYRKNDTPIENILDTLMTASVNPDKLSLEPVKVVKGAIVEAFYLSNKGEPTTVVGTVTDIVEDKVVIKSLDEKISTVKANAVYRDIMVGSTAAEAMDYLKRAYSNGNNADYEKMIEDMFNGV